MDLNDEKKKQSFINSMWTIAALLLVAALLLYLRKSGHI